MQVIVNEVILAASLPEMHDPYWVKWGRTFDTGLLSQNEQQPERELSPR